MSHFAKLDENNIVTFVTVGRQEDDGRELELCDRTGDTYRQTSYNTRGGVHYNHDGQPSADQSKALRKNYAGIGYTFDEERDAFIPPQPFGSWLFDEESCLWESPVELPAEGYWVWDEVTLAWIEAASI